MVWEVLEKPKQRLPPPRYNIYMLSDQYSKMSDDTSKTPPGDTLKKQSCSKKKFAHDVKKMSISARRSSKKSNNDRPEKIMGITFFMILYGISSFGA